MSQIVSPLNAIKVLHTLVWAFFASCIVAIPFFAWSKRFDKALILIGIVSIEVLIIALNEWRCPLTAVAAKYTSNRRDNFDIYLPVWLARHNKTIFGLLFAGGLLFTVARWLGWLG